MKSTTTAVGKKSGGLLARIKEEQDRIKKKKESSGSFEKVDWYKPEEGDNLIRILPAVAAGGLPFRTVQLHYITIKKEDGTLVKGVPVRCLHDFEEECPLCQAVKALYKGDEKSKEQAKTYRAKEVHLYNILNYKDRKVQPYAAGMTVHEEILNYLGDAGEEALDIEEGHNWKITKKVDPRKPKNLGIKYAVRMDIKASAIPSKLLPVLESAVELDTLYETREDDKMMSFIEALDVEIDFDEELEKVVKPATTAKKAATPLSKSKFAKAAVETEEEEEVETPKKVSSKFAKKTAAPVEPEEEEEEFGSFEDEDAEEVTPPSRSAKTKAAEALKSASKKKTAVVEEEEDDLDSLDDDLDAELAELGM